MRGAFILYHAALRTIPCSVKYRSAQIMQPTSFTLRSACCLEYRGTGYSVEKRVRPAFARLTFVAEASCRDMVINTPARGIW